VLTAKERFPLLLAAVARSDEVEMERIRNASRNVTILVPDIFGLAVAFKAVLIHHRLERVELAGLYLEALARVDAAWEQMPKEGWEQRVAKRSGFARFLGYLVKINEAGLKLFCDRLGLDPSGAERLLHGDKILGLAATSLESDSFTEHDALAYCQQNDPSVTKIKTAESIAEDLREAYDAVLEVI
jgi:hypothetical protein